VEKGIESFKLNYLCLVALNLIISNYLIDLMVQAKSHCVDVSLRIGPAWQRYHSIRLKVTCGKC